MFPKSAEIAELREPFFLVGLESTGRRSNGWVKLRESLSKTRNQNECFELRIESL